MLSTAGSALPCLILSGLLFPLVTHSCILPTGFVVLKEKCLLALIVGDGFTIFLSDVLIRF